MFKTITQTRFTCCSSVSKPTSEAISDAQKNTTEMLGSTGKAEAASYKPVLTAEKQDTTTTLKCATRHQVNILGFIKLNDGTALARLTRIPKNRGDCCVADFSSYKLQKTSVDSSLTHTRLQRIQRLFTLPLQDQNTTAWKECSFTAWKNLYSKYKFPQESNCTMLGHIHLSSCICRGRKSEGGFLLPSQETGGVTWCLPPWLTHNFNKCWIREKNILSLLRCRILVVSAFQHSESAALMKEVRCLSSDKTHDVHDVLWTVPPAEASRGRARTGKNLLAPLVSEGVPLQDTQTSRKQSQGHEMLPWEAAAQGARWEQWFGAAKGTSLSSVICRLNCTSVQLLLSRLVQVNLLIPK